MGSGSWGNERSPFDFAQGRLSTSLGMTGVARRSLDFGAVKRPHDGRAQRPFATTAGRGFHAAMALASSMVTQVDRGGKASRGWE